MPYTHIITAFPGTIHDYCMQYVDKGQAQMVVYAMNYLLIFNFGVFLLNARPGAVLFGRLLRLVFFLRTPVILMLAQIQLKLQSFCSLLNVKTMVRA